MFQLKTTKSETKYLDNDKQYVGTEIKINEDKKNREEVTKADLLQNSLKRQVSISKEQNHEKREKLDQKPEKSQSFSDRQKINKLPDFLKKSLISQAKNSKHYKPKHSQQETAKKSKIGLMLLSKLKSQQISCEICMGIITKKDKVSLCECSHIFCKNCLKQYVTYKIKIFEQVICPNQDCEIIMNQETHFYKSLETDVKKKYIKIHQFYKASKDPTLKLCPKDDCDGIIKITQSTDRVCGSCYKRFCAKCYFQEHKGQCDKNQIDFLQNNLHFKQCGSCGMVVQRTEGCNHMTCKCKYQFCYICGKKWTGNGHLCKSNQRQQNEQRPLFALGRCCQCQCQCCRRYEGCDRVSFIILQIVLFPVRIIFSIGVLIVATFSNLNVVLTVPFVFVAAVGMGLFCFSAQTLCQIFDENVWYGLVGIILFPALMIYGTYKALLEVFPETLGERLEGFITQVSEGMQSIWCDDQ